MILFALLASAQLRKSRDILEFFKKAGENAIKAISGLIPGGKPTSQLTTQPRGPRIPLNTINEDSIKPVIPYKRNSIRKLIEKVISTRLVPLPRAQENKGRS